MATSDDLWGGRLVGVAFDPLTHACDLRVTTPLNGVTSDYRIACRGVSELRFHNAIAEPWAYAEVTEAHLSADRLDDRQTLELILWSDDASLVVTCVAIDIRDTSK
ncbi:MAG TPA: hypothetical protein VFX15_07535 [Actinomycetes bacterium]|nr:hypothetical protein [Actinomycetes bacterium]